MYIGKVTGKVVSTIKDPRLTGISLVLVERLPAQVGQESEVFVAADTIGCGEGNTVLLAKGGAARMTSNLQDTPVDLAVIGIIDNCEFARNCQGKKQIAVIPN